MANKKLSILNESRQMAYEAVQHGVRTPKDLAAYFEDNGWAYDVPSRPTLEKLLKEYGVEYIAGRWELVE